MMKVMEWDVYVEKDFARRSLKVWVESRGEKPDERLNWFFKDGELVNKTRKIQEVMPEGFTPMFAGPVTMMREVIEQMAEAYPSDKYMHKEEHESQMREYDDLMRHKNAEIRKWEERFDRTLNAALENRMPIMATLESTVDEVDKNTEKKAVLVNTSEDEVGALVDSWPMGWRNLIGYMFALTVSAVMLMAMIMAFKKG
ncbi:MAG: hypothetical protein Q8K92_08120 [Leadbetterella sp.]|nr:hypothetical protein [Leadbetterella sp.]